MMAKKTAVKKASATKKTAATKKKSPRKRKRGTSSAGGPQFPRVRVQMFRQGLGDCFLVTLDDGGPEEKRILIDCGTLGNKFSDTNTQAIATYLQKLIKSGKQIDVLVATHEHLDHVSGFRKDLKPVLEGKVGEVWLAWTEDPEDADAQRLSKYKHDLGLALQRVSQVAPEEEVARLVSDLLGFAGDITLGASFAKTVDEAMDFIRDKAGGKTVYCEPGELIESLPGFRIYVLGPPRADESLKNMGSHGSDELYGVAASLKRAADRQLNDGDSVLDVDDAPFDARFNQQGEELAREQYPAYFAAENAWRRVDFDWAQGASELALQLDSLTNNTSLALAIERIADGKVLLFPADAQEGNWLSWHEPKLKWTIKESDGRDREIRAADLLQRTVFYKVGHHASHNATAKGQGLELMRQQDELVAFIPVDRALALTRNPKGSWQMPARALYRELLKSCQGRVVRADLGWAAAAKEDDPVEAELADLANADQWSEWAQVQKKAKHIQVDNPLFMDYVLE